MKEKNALPSSLAELLMQLDRQGIRDYRRYREVRKFMNFRAREKDIPISGSFELTPLCNLDCRMCYVHLNRDQLQGRQLLDVGTWKKLMSEAVEAGMMYARLTGGECLTYPGFRELYLYLREKGVETVVLSNGVLLDAGMIRFFRENPPAGIQVTLYGASEEAYERVTGHRKFAAVAENLQRARDAGLPLSVAVTPNAFMEDGEEIIRYVHSLRLPVSINSGLMAPRSETGREVQDASLDAYVRMIKLRAVLWAGEEFDACDEEALPLPGGTAEAAKGLTCGAGRSSFSISWNGVMRPCNTFPTDGKNVLELGFNQAWRFINKEVKEFPRPAECTHCSYRPVCKHCVAEHAAGAEIGHASPAVCAWARRMCAEGLNHIPHEE